MHSLISIKTAAIKHRNVFLACFRRAFRSGSVGHCIKVAYVFVSGKFTGNLLLVLLSTLLPNAYAQGVSQWKLNFLVRFKTQALETWLS